jgi:hypothetical protein
MEKEGFMKVAGAICFALFSTYVLTLNPAYLMMAGAVGMYTIITIGDE